LIGLGGGGGGGGVGHLVDAGVEGDAVVAVELDGLVARAVAAEHKAGVVAGLEVKAVDLARAVAVGDVSAAAGGRDRASRGGVSVQSLQEVAAEASQAPTGEQRALSPRGEVKGGTYS